MRKISLAGLILLYHFVPVEAVVSHCRYDRVEAVPEGCVYTQEFNNPSLSLLFARCSEENGTIHLPLGRFILLQYAEVTDQTSNHREEIHVGHSYHILSLTAQSL